MAQRSSLARLGVLIVAFVFSGSAFAATVTKLDDDVMAPVRDTTVVKRIRIDKLPLYDGKRSVIDLEEFQVWAPGAQVIIHGENGAVTRQDPPAMRFFRGLVNGDPESFAVFSVAPNGSVEGLVATKDGRYAVSAQRRPRRSNAKQPVLDTEPAPDGGFDYFLTQADPTDEIAPGQTWECVTDRYKVTPDHPRPIRAMGAPALPMQGQTVLTGTQKYSITVEVETDNEFYVNAASNTTTATNYITNLTAAVSTIYARDLKTNVLQSAVNIYTSASDPWAATTPSVGLAEIGDYYHSVSKPAGRTTSAVAMLSGKDVGGGIAWEGVICGADFSQDGHWAGPYSWCGGIGRLFGSTGLGSIPDVNGTQNGVLYGMPLGAQNFWPLAEYAHEVGHNMGGHHTHCVAISAGEAAGTNHPTQLFIDMCHTGEVDQIWNGVGFTPVPCATGTDYSSAPTERGTIMSYCHNIFNGLGYPQSRFVFGLVGEVSNHELTDYMFRAAGTLGGFANIVSGTTATLSSITAPGSVGASSTGNVASVTAVGGQTYAWSITGGSITGGGSTNSVTFSAGAAGSVVLTVIASNATRCSMTDSVTIPISSAIAAPTNLAATGTSSTNIQVTWTPSVTGGVTGYNVYRTDTFGVAYTQVGTNVSSPFNNTVSTNKAYLYYVTAVAGAESGPSNIDFGVGLAYTDTLSAGATQIRAIHLTELRTAASALRTLANQGATSFAEPSIGVGTTTVKASHISELRTFITNARTAMGFTGGTYSTTPVTGSVISTADINDLRNAAK